MRRPRFSVRALLLVIAALAVGCGGWLEYLRLSQLSMLYRHHAWGYGENVRNGLKRLAKLERDYQSYRETPNSVILERELARLRVEKERAMIAANANLVEIYKHAADHPWESVPRFAEPFNSYIENAPIPRWYRNNPAPPEPPRPTMFRRGSIPPEFEP